MCVCACQFYKLVISFFTQCFYANFFAPMYAIHTNQVVRRQTLRRKSTLSSLLFGEDEADALKSKNIKQTELVAALWPR